MSRIGKLPVAIPAGVKVAFEGSILKIEGPKGSVNRKIALEINLIVEKDKIVVSPGNESRKAKSLHGLTRTLVNNMVTGVTRGFKKSLEIVGIGYRAEVKDRAINLNLGYSHPINFSLPAGIKASLDKQTLTIEGADKELVGLTAAKIRTLRTPDVYKGKGIRYSYEVIRQKVGKSGAK